MGSICKIFGHNFKNEYNKPYNFRCKRCGELNREYLISFHSGYGGISIETINGSNDLDALKLLSLNGSVPLRNAARKQRMNLISKITDQTTLLAIVNGTEEHLDAGKLGEIKAYFDVCAAEQITDQTILTEIAQNHNNNPDIRCAAIKLITDQSMIEHIAQCEKIGSVWNTAVCTLKDQYTIFNILKAKAISDKYYYGTDEIKCLTDQNLIVELINSNINRKIRINALDRLTDISLITNIARNHDEAFMREAAVKKLTDESVLAIIAQTDKKPYVREAAIKNLTDESVLSIIAQTDKETSVRKAAINNLNDESLLTVIAQTDKETSVREVAIKKLTNEAVLAEIVLNDKENYHVALEKIKNKDMLFYILRLPESKEIKNDIARLLDGYLCKSCSSENFPQNNIPITCICNNCNAENHNFEIITYEVSYIADDRREIKIEKCTRCKFEQNLGSRELPAARLF